MKKIICVFVVCLSCLMQKCTKANELDVCLIGHPGVSLTAEARQDIAEFMAFNSKSGCITIEPYGGTQAQRHVEYFRTVRGCEPQVFIVKNACGEHVYFLK